MPDQGHIGSFGVQLDQKILSLQCCKRIVQQSLDIGNPIDKFSFKKLNLTPEALPPIPNRSMSDYKGAIVHGLPGVRRFLKVFELLEDSPIDYKDRPIPETALEDGPAERTVEFGPTFLKGSPFIEQS